MAEEIKKVISIETKDSYKTVKDLKNEINGLKDALLNLTPGTKEYDAAVKKLTTAQNQLNSVMNAGNGTNSAYAGSFQSLRKEIKEARDVMVGAAQGSDEYAAAAKRAAEASNKLRDMQQEIAYGSSGLDNKFAVMNKTLSGIAGGFAAAQGAMALFGVESENLQKTFVKLQAAISMTQGFKALAELPKALNAAKIAFGSTTKAVKTFTTSLKGVKGAIAATGIGLLLVLLGELVANWDAVTEAVSNFVGGMDHLKEVLAGVGNVIKNLVTGPLKALSLALHGHFKEAGETIKQAFSVAANYEEGAARQTTKNTQKRLREQAEADAKELDYQIRMNEAKKGSDWKYTEEAKKMYDEYFQKMLAQYDKNSDEYNDMLIKMEAYNREFTDHQKQEEEKRNQERQAAYEKAKALAEQQRQEYLQAAKAGMDAVLTTYGRAEVELAENLKALEPIVKKAFNNPPFKEYGNELIANAESVIRKYKDLLSEAFGEAGLTYDGFLKVLKDKNQAASGFYNTAIQDATNMSKEQTEEVFNAISVMLNKEQAVFQTYVNSARQTIQKVAEKTGKEAQAIIERYSKLAKDSINKNVLNEGDWKLFTESVDKILSNYLIQFNVDMAQLAIDLQIPFENAMTLILDVQKSASEAVDEVGGDYYDWLEEFVGQLLPAQLDANYKYTAAGIKNYQTYFKYLEALYEGDYDKWLQVQIKKREWEIDQDKHMADVRKDNLEKQRRNMQLALSYELLDLDKQNLEAQKKADESYWSVVYGEGTLHQVGKFFGFMTDESLKFYDQEIELENQRLENFTAGINAQIAELEKEKELEITTADEKKQIEYEIAELKQRLAEEVYRTQAKYKDLEAKKDQQIFKMKKSLFASTADLAGNVSEILNEYAQNNVETNKDAAERSFKWSKALAYGETWISTLATVQNIIKSFSDMGPWGVAAGAVAGAAALASGIARTVQIANQKLDDTSGGGSSSISTVSAVAVPQLESTPYNYTQNITGAEDEAKLNQPIIVQVSDIEDAMKVKEGRTVETSF